MLKYLTKIAMDILPSVVATVVGAYIVNHYINAKPAADTPPAAVSTVDPKNANGGKAETASIPEPGVKAKGISEKAMIEKTASERPAEVKPADGKAAESKAAESKATDSKPVETANAPADQRRHLFSFSRDKAVAEKPKAAPSPSPTAVAVAPSVPTPAPAASPTASAEASPAPAEEHRDAAELARAAIDRLRGLTDKPSEKVQEKSQVQEAARSPEPPKVQEKLQEPPRTVAAVPLRPLPPPITVSTPPLDQAAPGQQPAYPPYTASVDPNRPTPPADIPPPPPQPPLDLRADATSASPREHARNVAEDMLSAAKSVFHAVIPGTSSSSSSKFAD